MNETSHSRQEFPSGQSVNGELLADRLAKRPLAPEEALRYAIDIGLSLKEAHARGLVHGALSPNSIVISETGARVLQPRELPGPASAPYRSPQQVLGAPPGMADDIFAYGAILYEMASGKRAFPGEGADLDCAILERIPEVIRGGSPVYAAMEGVIAGCLQKDPARRRQRIQNAAAELRILGRILLRASGARRRRLPGTPPPVARRNRVAESWKQAARPEAECRPAKGPATVPPRQPAVQSRILGKDYSGAPRRRRAVLGLGLLAVAATAVAAVVYFERQPTAPVLRISVTSPDQAGYPGPLSISPDGRYLVFPADGPGGVRMLWLRPLDRTRAVPIAGTGGAAAPFWSPDSRSLAFFAGRRLKKVRIPAGPVETLCSADVLPGGGAWNRHGTILFAPGFAGGLYRVAAAGGRPEPVMAPDPAKNEAGYIWPQFLPDGDRFIFFSRTRYGKSSAVCLAALDRPQRRLLFGSETAAVWSGVAGESSGKRGYLLHILAGNLVARPFNASRMAIEGEPIPVAENIGPVRSLGLAPVSVSGNGILVYQTIDAPARRVVWMDRAGKQIATVAEARQWGPLRISPDGKKAVAARSGANGESMDLWILNTAGGATPLASPASHNGSPVWSPDGSRIACFSGRNGHYDLHIGGTTPGARAELAFTSKSPKYPSDWSHDGRYLLFGMLTGTTKSDIWALSVANRRAVPVLATVYNEGYPALSPDGNWMAYQSDESGEVEVYVQPFDNASPGTKRKWQVSQGSGALPRWRGDGAEIFYVTSAGNMMAAAVHAGRTLFSSDAPRMLFRTEWIPGTWNVFDVSSDGQTFLVNLPQEWSKTCSITVVTNWTHNPDR